MAVRSSSADTPAAGWCWPRATRCGPSASAAPCRWRARCALAPEAVVVPPRFAAYAEASEQVFAILERYSPLIEPLSLDEAFLDVTASQSLFGRAGGHRAEAPPARSPPRWACPPRPASPRPSSSRRSPRTWPSRTGSARSLPEETRAFLAGLPVSRLWGVGPKTRGPLHGLGLRKVGDLAIARRGLAHRAARGHRRAPGGARARRATTAPWSPTGAARASAPRTPSRRTCPTPRCSSRGSTPRRSGSRGGSGRRGCAPASCS